MSKLRVFACFCKGGGTITEASVFSFYSSPQDVEASEIKVQVCVYAFDLLYLNGEVRPGADEENITQRALSALSLSL